MAVTQEPIIARLDRLDNLMRDMEEMKGTSSSAKSSSSASTATTTRSSEGHGWSYSFMDDSPPTRRSRSEKQHCRPIEAVILETEHKGTLLDRVALMEDRLLKLTVQLKERIEAEKTEREEKSPRSQSHHKKGFKQIVKSCVHGLPKSKT